MYMISWLNYDSKKKWQGVDATISSYRTIEPSHNNDTDEEIYRNPIPLMPFYDKYEEKIISNDMNSEKSLNSNIKNSNGF